MSDSSGTSRPPRVGLVLGSGSARGWAHIGVIRALELAGIRPDIVCGTSIGALVGVAYAAGDLGRLEQWVRGLGFRDVVGFMDVSLNGGLLKGERLMDFFRDHFQDRLIEELDTPFAAVATSLQDGAEVWLREGSALQAVRASLALPGLFSPVVRDERILVDGGLVNPVPVSLARAMGAEILIAVDLSSDALRRPPHLRPPLEVPAGPLPDWLRKFKGAADASDAPKPANETKMPSMLDVLATSINIMQVRISRSRMAGEPPDVIVTPRLAQLGLLDFHRADEAIEEGHQAVGRVAELLKLLTQPRASKP